MNFVIVSYFLLVVFFLENIIGFVIFLNNKSWNIPVCLLRYTGNDERPLMVMAKAKKRMINGVPKLFIRTYPEPIRDYMSENYYPTPFSKYGGLILWEFEDGLLTPCIPEKIMKKLSPEQKEKLDEAYKIAQEFGRVDFGFDRKLYEKLRLKAVDDVDIEFMIQEISRIDRQYSPGWVEWFKQNGWMIGWLLLGVILLIIVILGFQKAPELAAACAGAAKDQVNALASAAASIAPGG